LHEVIEAAPFLERGAPHGSVEWAAKPDVARDVAPRWLWRATHTKTAVTQEIRSSNASLPRRFLHV